MQKIKSITIGNEKHVFAFEGKTIWECIQEERRHAFQDIPKCGKCGSKNLALMAFNPQNYKYVKVYCRDCKATLTFGTPREDPEVYYPRRKDGNFIWESYKKPEE